MTRDQIRDQIRLISVVEDGNVSDAQLNELITQAIHRLDAESDVWPFTSTTSNLSLTISTRTIDLPASFKFGVKLIDVDFDEPLTLVSHVWGFENRMDDDTLSTRPLEFWIWNNDIYLWPVPSANDTNRLTLFYYRAIADLTDDVTELEFKESFHFIIVYDVLAKIYLREEYFDAAQLMEGMRSRLVDSMLRFYSNSFNPLPYIWGEGMRIPRHTDPNLPLLDGV